ncbi:MAG: YceI family protein [bacterium]|nr:YceI family protein [bacterium]
MRLRKRIVIWGLVAFVAAVVAALVWWILRPEGPEAVDLEAAIARVEAADLPVAGSDAADGNTMAGLEGSVDAATSTSVGMVDSVVTSATEGSVDAATSTSVGMVDSVVTSSTEDPDDAPSTEIATSAATTMVDAVAEALIGVWTVVISEGADALSAESAVSFAGYRVVEVLAGGVDESTVVGRTAEVAGSIELSRAALVAATVEVEMATLRTDDSHRDSHMRQALNTKEFPLATFTLTEPVELRRDLRRREVLRVCSG